MNLPANASAPQIVDLALRLRQVKEAYRNFLTLWAAERMADESGAMQHLADDMDNQLAAGVTERHVAESQNNTWTLVHRERVLDD